MLNVGRDLYVIDALSAHIVLAEQSDLKGTDRVLEQLETVLKTKFGIDHSTIQTEYYSRRDMEMQH